MVFVLGLSAIARSQNTVAIKTNLLYDATANADLGFEFGLAPHWSLDISGNYNQWTIRDHKWKHWLVQPEIRYWFCDRFVKHFIGLHALGGQFNIGHIPNHVKFLGTDFSRLTDNRYQGWAVGAGIAYGYAIALGRHWNLELELGIGYAYLNYDRFACTGCGKKIDSGDHHYVGPTKAAINLVYVF